MLTKLCPTPFDAQAGCPRWLAFLDEVMGGDASLTSYLARAVGYSLTGDVTEHALFFCYGTGANGKSVFLNTLLTVMGEDYGCQIMPSLLTSQQGERHPTEMADLLGKRLVSANETDQGKRMSESIVKQLTGGDRIRARRMREDFWEFSPTHKIWLAGNHKPAIENQDEGIWRRIHMIPFEVTFSPEKQDKKLPVILASEASGILAWAVRGCLAWLREGLNPPRKVLEAVASYRGEQDQLGQFLAECCISEEGAWVGSKQLLDDFTVWLRPSPAPSRMAFAEMMRAKGYVSKHSSGGTRWLGLSKRESEVEKPVVMVAPLSDAVSLSQRNMPC